MLSNTVTPKYYGRFRDAVMRGEIPICNEISMEMNRVDALIANPNYYDDQAVDGIITYTIVQKGLMLLSSEKLYHHGIKGQRWGVRRFQNEDGTLTSEGKSRYSEGEQRESFFQKRSRHKQEKRWYSDNKRRISDSEDRYDDEYDRSESGKAQLKEYQKSIRKMYSGRDWTDEDDRKFSTTEKDYLKSQQKYKAEKLIKELGEENFAIYVSKGRVERGKDYAAEYIEQWKLHTV